MEKVQKGGGGARAENQKARKFKMESTVREGGGSGFSNFSQIQMTEIWSWFW